MRRVAVLAVVAAVAGCIEKPAPWVPDGRGSGECQAAGELCGARGDGEARSKDSLAGDLAFDVWKDVHGDVGDSKQAEAVEGEGIGDLRVVPEEVRDAEDGTGDMPGTDCVGTCDGKLCGDDGCGGSCGDCAQGHVCDEGQCLKYCAFVCKSQGIECGPSQGGEGCDCGKCSDEKTCTDDSCEDGKCVFVDNTVKCDDGKPCTDNDGCLAGQCVGQEVDCDDGNPCTNDKCVDGECYYSDNQEPCDDKDACTVGDVCEGGKCWPGAKLECDDDNGCTADSCDADEGCVYTPEDGKECDDGNPCTEPDLCSPEGECVGTAYLPRSEITIQKCVCDGQDPDYCEGKLGDGDPCNGTLECVEEVGTCGVVPGSVPDCNDGIPCTADSCVPMAGCENVANHAACADGNICTDDVCSGEGCVNPPNGKLCDDGDLCTDGDACVAGKCQPGSQVDCDDANPCTDDVCLPDQGCKSTWNAIDCDDGNACTVGDKCQNGQCVSGTKPLDCDIGQQCTIDTCDPVQGCVHVIANGQPCDDKDVCTVGDNCVGNVCASGSDELDCGDGNLCTEDSCDVSLGCSHAPVKDGTDCGGGKTCQGGVCQGGLAPDEDLEHDGVCLSPECAVNAGDTCPTTWNPDNDKSVCDPVPDSFKWTLSVELSEPDSLTGASTWRRTNEPVEVPLWNGILDDSVVGYWKLDGGDLKDFSGGGNDGKLVGVGSSAAGAFGDSLGAMALNVGAVDCGTASVLSPSGGLTVMAWVRPDAFKESETDIVNKWSGDGGNKGAYRLHVNGQKPKFDVQSENLSKMAYSALSGTALKLDTWHHVAGVFAPGRIAVFVDGRLDTASIGGEPCSALNVNSEKLRIGATNATQPYYFFHGRIDDVVIFKRALSPTEIAAYVESHAAFGTSFVPGAQPDFDDLRVSEMTPFQDEHQVPFEVIGPRPHSDTPCPVDDSNPAAVPNIADREDLCGVVAYWKLDGDAKDATGGHDGVLKGAPESASGRFGDKPASFLLDGTDDWIEVLHDSMLGSSTSGSFTIEAWVLANAGVDCGKIFSVFRKDTEAGTKGVGLCIYSGCRPYLSTYVGSKEDTAQAPDGISLGVWHHLAAVRDASAQEVLIYVDGMLSGSDLLDLGDLATPDGSVAIGASKTGGPTHLWRGRIDEVLLHSVAKSPEYIYRRANPGVPTVRFLASTEAASNGEGNYDWYQYALHWGDASAKQRPPVIAGLALPGKPCYGLLSGCLGYSGWWRFNEGSGSVAVDESTWKNNGTLMPVQSLPGFVWGREGTALSLNGNDQYVLVPYHASLEAGTDELTFEAAGKHVPNGPKGDFVGCKVLGTGGFQNSCSYSLTAQEVEADVYKQGTLRGALSLAPPPGFWFQSAKDSLPHNGLWRRLAMVLGGGQVAVSIDDLAWSKDGAAGAIVYDTDKTPLYLGAAYWKQLGWLAGQTYGSLDSVRLMSRALMADELLHYPMAGWKWCLPAEVCDGADNDCDGNVDEQPADCLAPSLCANSMCYAPIANANCAIKQYQNNVYMACYKNGTNWLAARDICTSWYGSHLVVLQDAPEEQFLLGKTNGPTYIGYTDQAVEGDWQWVFGSSNYDNWCPQQPDNWLGTENCASMKTAVSGGSDCWSDVNCTNADNRFICEAEQP